MMRARVLALLVGGALCIPAATVEAADIGFSAGRPVGRGKVIPRNLVLDGDDPARAATLADQGFLYMDRMTGESLRRVGPCALDLQQQVDGALHMTHFDLPCSIEPTMTATVHSSADERLRYDYAIRNGAAANDVIVSVHVRDAAGDVALAGVLPEGWRAMVGPHSVTVFPVVNDSPLLRPGGAGVQWSLTSRCLPALALAEMMANHVRPSQPLLPQELTGELNEILIREVSAATHLRRPLLVPAIEAPAGDRTKRQAAIDRLRADVELAVGAGLVSGDGAARLREILAELRREAVGSSRAALDRLETLRDVDDSYKGALRLVLSRWDPQPLTAP